MSTFDHETSALNYEAATEARQLNLIKIMQPKIYPDGDQWCVLYGDNLQEGVAGFGDTPHKAAMDFEQNWYNQSALKDA